MRESRVGASRASCNSAVAIGNSDLVGTFSDLYSFVPASLSPLSLETLELSPWRLKKLGF